MNILSPSILSANFADLGHDIAVIDKAGAEYVHIDVMDGLFVPSISFGMPVIKSVRPVTDKIFDVHLMINEPIRYIDEFVKSGADIITVHVEACSDVCATLEKIRAANVRVGITLNPATPVSVIEPYVSLVDMVLVMSVNPGFGGQKFIDGSLEKIREVKAMRDRLGLSYDIEVDGGINIENLLSVLNAGANVIVAGSAVFSGDAAANVAAFRGVMDAV